MSFNSFSFLLFFPVVTGIYYLIPSWQGRKLFLLAASYFFYACWNPPFVLLLIASSAIDFTVGRALAVTPGQVERRFLVAISCLTNFGVLVLFKYSGLILHTWQSVADAAGLPHGVAMPAWMTHIVLPVGISFYTFHGVSYIVDVYRGRIEVEKSIVDFMLFVAFFPQLVAGPILRAWYFAPQLHTRRSNAPIDWARGAFLIILGLFQKIALADNLAPLANLVFDEAPRFNSAELWLGVYAFSFQIYFDFAGYSNIAIGSARLLGFDIPENFRMPYIAVGFRDFWRRWHISLSTWLRDYLYIPLGGNRHGGAKALRNLFIVMGLGGLWHGASWTFVVWGLLHGLYLAVEHIAQPLIARIPPAYRTSPVARIAMAIVTFHLVCITWVFFRARTLRGAIAMLDGLLVPNATWMTFSSNATIYVVLGLLALVIALLTGGHAITNRVPAWAWGASAALMLFVTMVTWGDANEFIYFRF